MVFELKCHMNLRENPLLGKLELKINEIMILAGEGGANSRKRFLYNMDGDVADCELELGFNLYPSFPSNIEERLTSKNGVVANGSTNTKMVSRDSTTNNMGVDENGNIITTVSTHRDAPYFEVNESYSSLLFDCGINVNRLKTMGGGGMKNCGGRKSSMNFPAVMVRGVGSSARSSTTSFFEPEET